MTIGPQDTNTTDRDRANDGADDEERSQSGVTIDGPVELSDQTLSTYRYLRMSLISVLVLLAAAVAVQTVWRTIGRFPDFGDAKFESSISYYYWTPVRSVFVGALMAMGVSMVVLKADNEIEDILLNIAGVLAPVVALVPTPKHCVLQLDGKCKIPPLTTESVEAIRNNVSALILCGIFALLVFVPLAWSAQRQQKLPRRIIVARIVGLAICVGILAIGAYWFYHDRPWFSGNAHIRAASTLFGCIVIVVFLNAITQYLIVRSSHDVPGAGMRLLGYSLIAGSMLIVGGLALRIGSGPKGSSFIGVGQAYATLVAEVGVLVLFLFFWVLQSLELWNTGTRFVSHTPSLFPNPEARPRKPKPTKLSLPTDSQ